MKLFSALFLAFVLATPAQGLVATNVPFFVGMTGVAAWHMLTPEDNDRFDHYEIWLFDNLVGQTPAMPGKTRYALPGMPPCPPTQTFKLIGQPESILLATSPCRFFTANLPLAPRQPSSQVGTPPQPRLLNEVLSTYKGKQGDTNDQRF